MSETEPSPRLEEAPGEADDAGSGKAAVGLGPPLSHLGPHLPASPSAASQAGGDETASNGGSSNASGYMPSLLPYDVRRPPFELIMRLQQERSSILAEVSYESQERDWYRQQVEAIEKKVREERKKQQQHQQPPSLSQATGVPSAQSLFPPVPNVIEQLQSESERVTQGLRSRFGSDQAIEDRNQQRLRRIHDLDLAMLRLQQASTEDLSAASTANGRAGAKAEEGSRTSAEGSEAVESVADAEKEAAPTAAAAATATGASVGEEAERKQPSLVTTATQTSPADLALELTLPDILLREAAAGAFPHSPPSPYSGLAGAPEVCGPGPGSGPSLPGPGDPPSPGEPNVSGAGQTCKLEVVYSLLSMLGTHDTEDLSRTLLAMTSSPDSCHAMRQSGCLPLLVQLLHGSCEPGAPGAPLPNGSPRGRGSRAGRRRAAQALRNLVASNPEERAGRREMRVLKLLEQLRAHCDAGEDEDDEEGSEDSGPTSPAPVSAQTASTDGEAGTDAATAAGATEAPGPAVAALMKLSFDSEHHNAICTLGGVQAIADVLRVEHARHGLGAGHPPSITTRRYACMALTNLTFGDGANKALLCALRGPLSALVAQLDSASEDLRQVAASVLRNLSWRADLNSKRALREVGAPARLMRSAMSCARETTLKSVLSALWNLSAHCTENKSDICAVDGALPFLVSTLSYKSPSKTLAVIENGGGILRNTSSVIALRDDYRDCLRSANCLPILLRHLRSPSLTIVSNACGTLWNLSASCPRDQQTLWELGAVPMLRNLVHSKHKMISMGSASALKNLLAARPHLPSLVGAGGPPDAGTGAQASGVPGLAARKAKTAAQEAELFLAETSTPSSASTSRAASTASAPGHCGPHLGVVGVGGVLVNSAGPPGPTAMAGGVPRSCSKDSVHSDQTHDRHRHAPDLPAVAALSPYPGAALPYGLLPLPAAPSGHFSSMGRPAPDPATAGEWQSVARGIEELQLASAAFPPGPAPVPIVPAVAAPTGPVSPPGPGPQGAPAVPVPSGPAPHHRLSTATNEDQEPLTFCTEGTPYGVSTAASVSDLCQVEPPPGDRHQHDVPLAVPATLPPPPPPPPPPRPPHLAAHCLDLGLVRSPGGGRSRLTRHRASVTSADGNESDANSEKPQDFGSRFGEGSAPTATATAGLPAVSPRTYAVEDTPVTGGASRCSSLSSISELDEAGAAPGPGPSTVPVQGTVAGPAPTGNSGGAAKAKLPAAAPAVPPAGAAQVSTSGLERIDERASSEAREAAASPGRPLHPALVHGLGGGLGLGKKTVTFVTSPGASVPVLPPPASFSPPHPPPAPAPAPALAEETPLMFSRSSSLSSLGSSLGERSLHSSVVSEYSRSRNSEVVSPSELPDSPTAARKCAPEPEPGPAPAGVAEGGTGVPTAGEAAAPAEARSRPSSASSASSAGAPGRLLSQVIQSALPPAPAAGGPSGAKKRAPGGDCLTLYATEDTPQGFSTMASSLSDLTVDSASRPAPARALLASPGTRPPSGLSGRSSLRYGPVVYATEGTPALYSYNSPLSSLFLSPVSTGGSASPAVRPPARAPASASAPAPAPASGGSARPSGPGSEDRSSLSSLSLDSAGLDRSLLEECISSALPKMAPPAVHRGKGHQRSAGVGAPAPVPAPAPRPSRSSTMPLLPPPSARAAARPPPPPGATFMAGGGAVMSMTVGRLSRKEAAGLSMLPTGPAKPRHQAVPMEPPLPPPPPGQQQPASVQHQRSRSAGATAAASRVDLKASRLPGGSGRAGAPLPPVPTAAQQQQPAPAPPQPPPGPGPGPSVTQFWGSAPISPSAQVKGGRKSRMHKSKSATDEHGVAARRRSSSNAAAAAAAVVDLQSGPVPGHPGHAGPGKPSGWRSTSFSRKKKRQKAAPNPGPVLDGDEQGAHGLATLPKAKPKEAPCERPVFQAGADLAPPSAAQNASTGNFLADGSDVDRVSAGNSSSSSSRSSSSSSSRSSSRSSSSSSSRRRVAIMPSTITTGPAPRRNSERLGGVATARSGVGVGTISGLRQPIILASHQSSYQHSLPRVNLRQKSLTLPIIKGDACGPNARPSLIPYSDLVVRQRCQRRRKRSVASEMTLTSPGSNSICEVTYSLSTPSDDGPQGSQATAECLSPLAWADLEVDVNDDSLEIDAADCHKPPLDDPLAFGVCGGGLREDDTDEDVDSDTIEDKEGYARFLGQGLDDLSVSSDSLPSLGLRSPPPDPAEPPPRRARIVKPDAARAEELRAEEGRVPPRPPPASPGGVRGGRRSVASRRTGPAPPGSARRPPPPAPPNPVRLTKAAAQRMAMTAGVGPAVAHSRTFSAPASLCREANGNSGGPAGKARGGSSGGRGRSRGRGSARPAPSPRPELNNNNVGPGPWPGKEDACCQPAAAAARTGAATKAVRGGRRGGRANPAETSPRTQAGEQTQVKKVSVPPPAKPSPRQPPAATAVARPKPTEAGRLARDAGSLRGASGRGRGKVPAAEAVAPEVKTRRTGDARRRVDRTTKLIEPSDVLTATQNLANDPGDSSAAGGPPLRPSSSNLTPRVGPKASGGDTDQEGGTSTSCSSGVWIRREDVAPETIVRGKKPSSRVTPFYRSSDIVDSGNQGAGVSADTDGSGTSVSGQVVEKETVRSTPRPVHRVLPSL